MNSFKKYPIFFVLSFFFNSFNADAQYKAFKLNKDGDTINIVSKAGLKEGKWVTTYPELRGEPGYDEEGMYIKDKKEGYWRRYTAGGDIIAIEYYMNGGKDGLQQYFTPLGTLILEESWKGYNPDAPYDTIPIYGTGSGEIVSYKIVKAEQYSVKHGPWKYYDTETGELFKTVRYVLNNIYDPNAAKKEETVAAKPKKTEKTPEMLEWEKKNKGKKKALREGMTGL